MIKCLGCGSSNTNIFLDIKIKNEVKSSWGVTSKSRTIYHCQDCELKFVDIGHVDIQEEMNMYDQTYHEEMAGRDEESESLSGTREQSLERLALIHPLKKEGKLLDIGASTGVFLEKAKEEGYSIFGIEPSDYACNNSRQRLGLSESTYECGIIENSKLLKNETFDIITLWDVIEHCYDINSDMKILKSALNQDGLLVLRTPDSDSIFFKIANWLYYLTFKQFTYPVSSIYHADHQVFFNKKSLKQFLLKYDFEVILTRNESLQWKRFKYCECRRHFLINLAIGSFYWLGRLLNRGHGLIMIARKKKAF